MRFQFSVHIPHGKSQFGRGKCQILRGECKYKGIMGSVKLRSDDFISLQYKRHQVQCNQSGFVIWRVWGVRQMNVILNDWSRTT